MEKITSPEIQPVNQQYIFPLQEMPSEIFGVKISDQDKENLAKGNYSNLLENMQLEDGTIIDGKVKLNKDKETGEFKLSIEERKPELKIGNKFLSHTFSKEDKKNLLEGKAVGPLTINSGLSTLKNVFLQVDSQLNKIVVKSSNQLSVFDKLGGYKLNDRDKNLLANNEKIPPRVYQGKDGKYFTAEIKLTDDKKGLEYHNVKMLSNKQALELKPKLNVDHDISTIAGTFQGREHVKAQKVEPGQEKELKDTQKGNSKQLRSDQEEIQKNDKAGISKNGIQVDDTHQKAILDASQRKDIKMLKELSNTNPPTKGTIESICKNSSLSKNDRLQHLSALKIDVTKHLDTINKATKEEFTKKFSNTQRINDTTKITTKTQIKSINPLRKEI